MKIVERKFDPKTALALVKSGLHPVHARVLAARGVTAKADVVPTGNRLLPYSALTNTEKMAKILADAVVTGKRLLIVADYDADGATACSIGLLALKAFGANVGYLMPDRVKDGYGLTPLLAKAACTQEIKPDFVVTVDCGIASHEGIDVCNDYGVPVLVTDHHLAAAGVQPAALMIVNPNQHGCDFPSKALAGCGVMYYVMWALQDELVERGHLGMDPTFSVTDLLPIVAIGTVADVVSFDVNNRILVNEGLLQIRQGTNLPGIEALAKVSGKNPRKLSTSDIAFGIAPRINAAGRLDSMDAGVECLTTRSEAIAEILAQQLNDTNDTRKEIEGEMVEQATRQLLTKVQPNRVTAVLHSDAWHQGVIGIVAGRIKEQIWRPTFTMATAPDGSYKGSGRSIPGLHLRDALVLVDSQNPGVLKKYGGHAMAAGVSVYEGQLEVFAEAFETVCRALLTAADLAQQIEVDGGLEVADMNLDMVAMLKNQAWGQNFTEPCFSDVFKVVEARPIGNGLHLKLLLEKGGVRYGAVKFRHKDGPPPPKIRAVYTLDGNTFNNKTSLQLLVSYLEAA
jgi:single-stranded-DNA-specific exonuclease